MWGQYDSVHTQGISQYKTAQVLDVPRSTLQAWHLYYQDRLNTRSEVVAFVHSIPGLTFLHHLASVVQVGPQRGRCAWHGSRSPIWLGEGYE